MSIRVLGCSGSIAAGSRTTSFLVDGSVLVDAGTGVGDLALDELERIDHIFVSHSHLDHVLAIGLLADSVARRRIAAHRAPIEVHALRQTIEALRTHVFNGVIWPDFSRLPSQSEPILRFAPFTVGERIVAAGRCIEVLPAEHTVPACGFAVFPRPDGGGAAWVYSGDTGPNPGLWRRLQDIEARHLVIETAFRDDERELAHLSRHLHPLALRRELCGLTQPAEVWVTHMKPGEVDTVMGEIASHPGCHVVRALAAGQVMVL
jgi:ribonuclease BN (tRNA processing enzyme)